jgi:opacity protein-like surface antigen
MKKFLVTATLAVALVSGAYASDVKVSSKIESAFKREF